MTEQPANRYEALPEAVKQLMCDFDELDIAAMCVAYREERDKLAAEVEQLRVERDQYAAAIRQLILQVRQTAYLWTMNLPASISTAEVARALMGLCSPVPFPEKLRDDLWQRIAGAYYLRFEDDGHPEDSQGAADVAMSIVQPELDRRDAELEQLRRLVPGVVPDREYVEYQVVGDWGVDGAGDADEADRRVRESLAAYPRCGAVAEQRSVRVWEGADGETELYGPWRPLAAEVEQLRAERDGR